MPSGEPGDDKVQQGSEDGQQRLNRPLAVSCLYSVMSRLSAVVFPDVRIAIVVNGVVSGTRTWRCEDARDG
jgi:hypothetical protein